MLEHDPVDVRLRGVQHVILHEIEGVERVLLTLLRTWRRRAAVESRYCSRSSNIVSWVPRLKRLPSSSLSCLVSRIVWMICCAAVRFLTTSDTVVAAKRIHSTGLMPRTSSA